MPLGTHHSQDKRVNKPVKSISTEKSRFIFESLRSTLPKSRVPSRLFSSPFILIYGFAILIALGTAFLMLPISNTSGSASDLITALFTAISAVTVTGAITANGGLETDTNSKIKQKGSAFQSHITASLALSS